MLTPHIMLTNQIQQDTLFKTNCSQGLNLEQGIASHPPSRSSLVIYLVGGGDSRHFGPTCLPFLYWCQVCLAACILSSFSFLTKQTYSTFHKFYHGHPKSKHQAPGSSYTKKEADHISTSAPKL